MNISINLLPALLSVILLELSMSVAAIKPRIARKILMIPDLMTRKKRTLSLGQYYYTTDKTFNIEVKQKQGGLLFEKCRLNLHLIWRNCLHAPLGVHHFASSEYWISMQWAQHNSAFSYDLRALPLSHRVSWWFSNKYMC